MCATADCAALVATAFAALSPCWDAHMNFKIRTPELCLIRFCVRDQTGLLSSEFVGQYTLPFSSLKKGEPPRSKRAGEGVCVCVSGGKLHQGTWCDCVQHLHPVSTTEGCLRTFTGLTAMFPFASSHRLLLGPALVTRRMQPGSSLSLRLGLVFLKTASF